MFADQNGRVYAAVSGREDDDNRIVVLDKNLNLLQTAEGYTASDGRYVRFEEPLGIFVDTDSDVYICDGKTKEVLHLDAQFREKLVIPAPTVETTNIIKEEFTERYRPSKLAVDPTGRIHVVAININEGIVEFEPDGTFTGFLAAGKVKYSTIELLWRRFSTAIQRERMKDFVPVEYNNIELDADGYLFATLAAMDENAVRGDIESGKGSDQGMVVRRINYRGSDIMDRNGYGPVVGDLAVLDRNLGGYTGISHITDVSRGENGTFYASGQQPQPYIHLFTGRVSVVCILRSGCDDRGTAHAGGGNAAGRLSLCRRYRYPQHMRISADRICAIGASGSRALNTAGISRMPRRPGKRCSSKVRDMPWLM